MGAAHTALASPGCSDAGISMYAPDRRAAASAAQSAAGHAPPPTPDAPSASAASASPGAAGASAADTVSCRDRDSAGAGACVNSCQRSLLGAQTTCSTGGARPAATAAAASNEMRNDRRMGEMGRGAGKEESWSSHARGFDTRGSFNAR
jgi:hypothetical protein